MHRILMTITLITIWISVPGSTNAQKESPCPPDQTCCSKKKCCPDDRKCIKKTTAKSCQDCFIEIKKIRKDHDVIIAGYKKQAKTAEKKHKKKIQLMEKRLSDQRDVLTEASKKDKKAAFNSGILWGGGIVIGTIVVVAAVVLIVRLTVPAAGMTPQGLTIPPNIPVVPIHQPLFATVR